MATTEYSQFETFVVQGHWWIPGNADRVAGELYYKNGELELRLFGAFHKTTADTPFHRRPVEREIPLIHGESFDLEPITAFKAFYTEWGSAERNFWSSEPGGIKFSALHVHCALVGAHTLSETEQRYVRCSVQLPHLESWLDDRPFTYADQTETGWKTEYTQPARREFALPVPFKGLQIRSSVLRSGVPPFNRCEVVHRANISVEPVQPQPMSWFDGAISGLERLLSLLSGKPMQTEKQWLYSRDNSRGALLYYNRTNTDQTGRYGPNDLLFRYPDIAEHFGLILGSWLTQTTKIQHALNLFFASLREPGTFLETRFLPIIQSLEVYARAVDCQTYVDPREYNETIRQRIESSVPQDIDKDLRTAIIGKLKYANEYSLRTRLRRMIRGLTPETAALFCKDPNAFIGGVVDTRNYLTHYSADSLLVLQGLDLHWATIKLRTMFVVVLLKWAGLPEPLIRERVKADISIARERKQWIAASERGSRIEDSYA